MVKYNLLSDNRAQDDLKCFENNSEWEKKKARFSLQASSSIYYKTYKNVPELRLFINPSLSKKEQIWVNRKSSPGLDSRLS